MTPITFRPDAETEQALAVLAEDAPPETTRTDILRKAVLAAAQEVRNAKMRAEAQRLANDPADQAELRAVMAEMDQISAW